MRWFDTGLSTRSFLYLWHRPRGSDRDLYAGHERALYLSRLGDGGLRRDRYGARWSTKFLLMSHKKISSGVVHELPADLKKALTSDPQALTTWEDITPLARNEWICWIESAKKAETRSRRIEWGCSSLRDGKRRPCCWPGCDHR